MKKSSQLTGVAGEYFVAAELSRRNLVASISLRNTRGIDILVTTPDTTRSRTIQCKTSSGIIKKWVLTKSSESFCSDTHFYVFVALGDINTRPAFHIVPSGIVAKTIREGHQQWLDTLGRGGRKHRDNPVRNFVDPTNKYLDQWELLGL